MWQGMGLFQKKQNSSDDLLDQNEKNNQNSKKSSSLFSIGKKKDEDITTEERQDIKEFNKRVKLQQSTQKKDKDIEGKQTKKKLLFKKEPKEKERQYATTNESYTFFGKAIKGNMLAIDLLDKSAKLILAKNKKDDLEILQVVDAEMPDNSIINGDIIDQEAVFQALRSAIEINNLSAKYAMFSINGERIIRREIRIPFVEEKDIEGLINFELEQYLDIDTESYIIEYELIEQEQNSVEETLNHLDEVGRFLDVLVYAVPKGMVENRFEIAKKLKLIPYVLDIHSNGLEKWAQRVESINNLPVSLTEKNIGFIQITNQTVDVYLYSKGEFITNNHARINYQFIVEVFEREERLKKINDLNPTDHQYPGIINAINEWTSATTEHILATEEFYSRTQATSIDTFYVYGNDNIYAELVPFLEKHFGRTLTNIEEAQLQGISWMNANAHTCTPDLIQATAMLIRRA